MKDIDFKEHLLSLNSPYWQIQKIGYLVLFILIVAALIGLTGNGIFGTTIKADSSGLLKVEYDPILRSHSDTVIRLWVRPQSLSDKASFALSLSQTSFANAIIKQINPKPISESIDGANLRYTFSASNNSTAMPIQIWFEPQIFGKLNTTVNFHNQSTVTFQQLILP